MLRFILTDSQQHTVALRHPLKVSLSRSDQAPADRLEVVFAVTGQVPVLSSVEVRNGEERVFFGYVDEQAEEYNAKGRLLTLTARSLAAVLLDNEAAPQTYCLPSMPLLMQRHFIPLGFTAFAGSAKAYSGELTVTKGMSEWSVLQQFGRYFTRTEPKIRQDGVIDLTGDTPQELLILPQEALLTCRHEYRPRVLFSDIWARSRIGGGYTIPLVSEKANALGIRRRRYVNVAGTRERTVLSVKEMLQKAESAYERLIVTCSGCRLAEVGSGLQLSGHTEQYRIRELYYALDSTGERTSIYAERMEA